MRKLSINNKSTIVILAIVAILFIFSTMANAASSLAPREFYGLVMQFGKPGSGEAEFGFSTDVAVDKDGNIYVADMKNNNIQKYDHTGHFIRSWDASNICPVKRGHRVTKNGDFFLDEITSIEANEKREGIILKMDSPISIDIDHEGSFFIAIPATITGVFFCPTAIFKFDNQMNSMGPLGGFGTSEGGFEWAMGVDFDREDNVYVAERTIQKVIKISYDRKNKSWWGLKNEENPRKGYYVGFPDMIAVDGNDEVYAIDYALTEVFKYNDKGKLLKTYKLDIKPLFIVIDKRNNEIFIRGEKSIYKYDKNFRILAKWNLPDQVDNRRDFPFMGMDVDGQGDIFVVDRKNSQILKYSKK
jgi:hypothetical protein